MADPRVKRYHFTCTTCRQENDVNTLFCTLMDPAVVSSCICPQFVDIDKNCAGPNNEGLFHIFYALDNVNVTTDTEIMQFILSVGDINRTDTATESASVHKIFCAFCETLIGYEYVRMLTTDGQMKFTIVENKLRNENINSENPAPVYLLNEHKVTKFLTKRN